MARPKKNIDGEQVRELAAIGCTHREIAAVCRCSVDTLKRRFAEEMDNGAEEGKTRLRKALWQNALSGNVTAQIWLSKNVLGYSDKTELSGPDGGPAFKVYLGVDDSKV